MKLHLELMQLAIEQLNKKCVYTAISHGCMSRSETIKSLTVGKGMFHSLGDFDTE